MKKQKQVKSLRITLLFFIVCSCLIPIVSFTGFIFLSYNQLYITKTEELIESELRSSAILLSSKLDEAVKLIQNPSYDRSWELEWNAYQEGTTSDFYRAINASLKKKYYMDSRFDMYAFYSVESEMAKVYSSRTGFSYNSYLEKIEPGIVESRELDSDYVQLKIIDNRIFLIRNLYTVYGYEKYGTLVLGMNTFELFKGFPADLIYNVAIDLNSGGNLLFLTAEKREEAYRATEIYQKLTELCGQKRMERFQNINNQEYKGYLYEMGKNEYHIDFLCAINKKEALSGLNDLYRMIVIMTVFFIGLVFFLIYYMKKQIEIPVERLVHASRIIKEGHIGTKVEGEPMPNAEFAYLVDSFNTMSEQVEHLFNTAYNEKLARKDAQIAALQAQINPHFLNNTLEMMNWQARMSGDIKVCKMIEALGTVLDHSMNRDNKKEIYLSEELRSADAYLYIMSMRFGQRLQTEKVIDESLLWIHVPQLILQPLIENAILHGIEKVKSGKITIHIYHDDENVYLDVINTGKNLDEKTITRIQGLLAGDESNALRGSGRHTSIGISNVNKRIKLVYGEKYGLSVSILEEERFLSKITIPLGTTGQE